MGVLIIAMFAISLVSYDVGFTDAELDAKSANEKLQNCHEVITGIKNEQISK